MRTIGLLGGMSWESTVTYYRLINQGIAQQLGGLHSAKILLYSVDFHQIEQCQSQGRWEDAGALLANAAQQLEQIGAEAIVLCTNTMHKIAPQIQAQCTVPLLHIADATGQAIRQAKLNQVALLGTRYTMEQDFYRHRLLDNFGITSIIPDEMQRLEINRIIFDELCHGKIQSSSKRYFQSVIGELCELGAEGVIFGCTEIGLLLEPQDVAIPVFDTTVLHTADAVSFMLAVDEDSLG